MPNPMKDQFYGYYPASDDEIDAIWKDSIIAFDANALLNIYRYSENTRDNFLKVLEHFKDRLWIPYQAAAEYHNNRIDVIKKTERDYAELKKQLGEHKHKIQQLFNGYKRHPHIDTKNMFTPIEKAFDEVSKVLDLKEKEHPEYLKEDKIFPAVSDLFDSKVGKAFSDSEHENIYKEGEERYSKKIPPGFADFKKKQNCEKKSLYGDFIIWKELIRKASDSSKTLIFVTDDRKEDWWNIRNGETIGPREELIKEFHDETGLRILIYNSDSFLRYAQDKMIIEIEDSSIQEVQRIRDVDEKMDNLQINLSIVDQLEALQKDNNFIMNLRNISQIVTNFHNQYGHIPLQAIKAVKPMQTMIKNLEAQSLLGDIETIAAGSSLKDVGALSSQLQDNLDENIQNTNPEDHNNE